MPVGMAKDSTHDGLRRITVSMPEDTYQALDRLVTERGFDSRSQAIVEMIHQQAAEHLGKIGTQVMAGTLTMIYDESKSTLLAENDYHVNLKNEIGIDTILRGQGELIQRMSLLEKQVSHLGRPPLPSSSSPDLRAERP